jgi:hypothetical protein
MRAIEVVLDFCCGACGSYISATVRCAGKGLAAGPHTVAAARIACPACGGTNQVCFEPCGRVRAVDALRSLEEVLEPSFN